MIRDLGLSGVDVAGANGVGGLVGTNRGSLAAGYGTDRVWGGAETGGLIGAREPTGTVTDGYWDTDTSGHPAGTSGTAGEGRVTATLQAPKRS